MNRFPPQQFNFTQFWFHNFKKLESVPAIVEALETIKARWIERTEFIYEEEKSHNPKQAKAEYQLRLITGEVMVRNFEWLRDQFENIDLCELALAIAEEVYPDKVWKIIEGDATMGMDAIVTDDDYSVVFDMQYFDEIQAGSSLLLVRAEGFDGTPEQAAEAQAIIEELADHMSRSVETARGHLEDLGKPGSITQLHPDKH